MGAVHLGALLGGSTQLCKWCWIHGEGEARGQNSKKEN